MLVLDLVEREKYLARGAQSFHTFPTRSIGDLFQLWVQINLFFSPCNCCTLTVHTARDVLVTHQEINDSRVTVVPEFEAIYSIYLSTLARSFHHARRF